jgi:hypothetical protein
MLRLYEIRQGAPAESCLKVPKPQPVEAFT